MPISYHALEEEVFNLLYQMHLVDSQFCFSVRKHNRRNAQYDYFIGTENSSYFAFTLWYIPLWYPGASMDILDFVVTLQDNQPNFYFHYFMSKNTIDRQNELNLEFLNILKSEFNNYPTQDYISQNRSEKYLLYPSTPPTSSNYLLSLSEFIKTIMPKIDNAISTFKNQHASWNASRIPSVMFSDNLKILKRRLKLNFDDTIEELNDSQEQKEIEKITLDPTIDTTEKESLIKSRRGQSKYRNDLLNLWRGCSITRLNIPQLLRASHIKPWRICDNFERLDKFNGLLLLPTYDLLFEKYLITFDDMGKIMISQKISPEQRSQLGVTENIFISLEDEHKIYLAHHRQQFYISENVNHQTL